MPHRNASSFDSQSSLNSLSSTTSVRSQSFKEHVDSIRTGPIDPETLVQIANTLIENLSSNEKDVYQYGGYTLKLHPVLREMLVHADDCGGEQSTRYVAASVLGCIVNNDRECLDTLQMLHDLAVTWVSYLLFIFKANCESRLRLGDTSRDRSALFKELLERDGYQCIVSGFPDAAHPVYKNRDDVNSYYLEKCYILHRVIANFDSQEDSEAYHSAVTTFDILRNYANLPQGTLCDLEGIIDDPSNGLLLSKNVCYGFDNFHWCLKKTETENKYTVKIYSAVHGIPGMTSRQSKDVEFKDRSGEFLTDKEQSSQRKRSREIPLPEPCYINIHAAIAGILHTSGAGEFLDELLKKFGGRNGFSTVQTWEDFDRVVRLAVIKQQLIELAIH